LGDLLAFKFSFWNKQEWLRATRLGTQFWAI
jgi:hypothetical protein